MKLVIIGGSAGSLEPLRRIVSDLPVDLDAAVLVLRHRQRTPPTLLPSILERDSRLPVREAVDGEPIRPSHIYVAPGGCHVTVHGGRLKVQAAPDGQGPRPDIDLALESAAETFGDECIGVILSGFLDDGTQGAIRLARVGGTTLVQEPRDAEQASMPRNVIARDHPSEIVPSARLGQMIVDYVNGEREGDALIDRAAQA